MSFTVTPHTDPSVWAHPIFAPAPMLATTAKRTSQQVLSDLLVLARTRGHAGRTLTTCAIGPVAEDAAREYACETARQCAALVNEYRAVRMGEIIAAHGCHVEAIIRLTRAS